MSTSVDTRVAIVVPNWNGADGLRACVDSLLDQTIKAHVIVVDNGSVDRSVEILQKHYPSVEIIRHSENKGYAGGVNPGFQRAIDMKLDYVAPFNNDAVADKDWLKHLVSYLDKHPEAGIAACKLLSADGRRLDSTGDYYTNWGLPYPRGRGEGEITKYDQQTEVFAASGGASLNRVKMLEETGLLDEDFFAYYEDVDLSFRAQLAGWKVAYVPASLVYHEMSVTGKKIKGFFAYQTMKNLQLLHYKNVPKKYFYRVGWRLNLAMALFFLRAISRGQGWAAFRGDLKGSWLILTSARAKRRHIQSNKKVPDEYIWQMIVHDLPPNARALRKLRASWWKMSHRKAAKS